MFGVTRRLGCFPLIGQQVALGAFLVLRHELLAHTRRAVISAGRTVPSGGQGMRILSGAMCPGSIQHLGVTLASEIARWDLCGFCASANTAWMPVSSHRADVDGSHQAYLIVNLSRQRHIQLCIDRNTRTATISYATTTSMEIADRALQLTIRVHPQRYCQAPRDSAKPRCISDMDSQSLIHKLTGHNIPDLTTQTRSTPELLAAKHRN
ncbi:hypothetical protein SCLCIDRAFT_604044 [Scleroderma citrinum Foug A]|uniref:Uncharacterized protein n=1 Tax=Scleroderma citrinum Foug A TaxID=1036808 RepID=A0A0C2ZFV9_9AGAM|nr:hypothetical protein SCLCIDRAFT_604044 [Scleroderma citrinum Foug A]